MRAIWLVMAALLLASSAGCSQETVAARRIALDAGAAPLKVTRIHVFQEGWDEIGLWFNPPPRYATAAVLLECEDGRVLVVWRSSRPLHEAARDKPVPDRQNDLSLQLLNADGDLLAEQTRAGPTEHHLTLWPSADGAFRSDKPGTEGHQIPPPPLPDDTESQGPKTWGRP